MRTSYVQDPVTFELIPKELYHAQKAEVNAPMVMGDIQPYISQADGSLISSRGQHRAHLRQHNCIEIGNEIKAHMAQSKPKGPPPGLKDTIIRAFQERGL